MAESGLSETWHVLTNGISLVESRDVRSGEVGFVQLQSTRQVEPNDLRLHDEQRMALLVSVSGHWAPVVAVGRFVLAVLVIVGVVGIVLAQFDPTETTGGSMFWVGIPLAVILWAILKVLTWRVSRRERAIEVQAGLTPGMVDEIDADRARELIETHGERFTQGRADLRP